MTKFQEWLKSERACSEDREWVGERTAVQTWNELDRADRLIWLAHHAGVPMPQIVLATVPAIRPIVEAHRVDDDTTSIPALDAAETWGKDPTDANRQAAARAARAASGSGMREAARAAWAAAWAAGAGEAGEAHRQMCETIRSVIPCPDVLARLEGE